MANKEFTEDDKIHKKMAIDLFNYTWELLDKEKRTIAEDDEMIHASHASRFHWGKIGTPTHFERGEWQISRVYSVLCHPQAALYHAQRCLAICEENEIADFDLAFAYEAVARAYAVTDNDDEKKKFYKLAQIAGEQIKETADKDYFLSELKTI